MAAQLTPDQSQTLAEVTAQRLSGYTHRHNGWKSPLQPTTVTLGADQPTASLLLPTSATRLALCGRCCERLRRPAVLLLGLLDQILLCGALSPTKTVCGQALGIIFQPLMPLPRCTVSPSQGRPGIANCLPYPASCRRHQLATGSSASH